MNPIIIIGGGPTGMEAAHSLAQNKYKVLLFEKEAVLGNKILRNDCLFPNFAPAEELAEKLVKRVTNENITLYQGTEITDIARKGDEWEVVDNSGNHYSASAILIATGYETFDAKRKEELGYGIYDGVITSVNLEKMLKEKNIVNSIGEAPKRVVFLQCVGSRDEKSGNHYCSRVCCIAAVKQSIEVKKLLPDTDVYCFYMDLRMSGQFYEELYRKSQEIYGVRFVRGRISEAAATFDGKVQVKSEDTLVGLPLKMTTDLLVLMVGMEASDGTKNLAKKCQIAGEYGFADSIDRHLHDNLTQHPGLFLAGTCKRPMGIADAIADTRSAVVEIMNYLNK